MESMEMGDDVHVRQSLFDENERSGSSWMWFLSIHQKCLRGREVTIRLMPDYRSFQKTTAHVHAREKKFKICLLLSWVFPSVIVCLLPVLDS
ncbi:hypothetical protein Peur_006153 [Populus x canadensis]